VLSGGTAYITDVGMTGPLASVIGVREKIAVDRFLTQIPWKFDVATGEIELQGVVMDIRTETGKAETIERMRVPLNDRS
jgi:hypothetical protein